MSKNGLCLDLFSTVTTAINDCVWIISIVFHNLDIDMIVYIIRQRV